MGGVRILAFAYRKWALGALIRVVEHKADAEIFIAKRPEDATVERFERVKPHLVLFYGWSWMVPDEIVDRWLCVCLHPSPLPKYRGGSPIQHQIINGETESAVTFFRMTREMDAGPICAQVPLSLEGTLADIFGRVGSVAVNQTLSFIDTLGRGDQLRFTEQDEGRATARRRRKPEESWIKPEELCGMPARYLHDKIRALSGDGYPAAFIVCADGERLYLTGSRLEEK